MENVTRADVRWVWERKHAKIIQTDHERANNQVCCDINDENRHQIL